MIEIIEGTWAAGETKTYMIQGEYLELLDAQYQCDVFLMDAAGAQLSVMRKCEASFFSKPTGGFRAVQITSAQAQYIRFFVGSGDAGTRRISSTVSVIDGGRARVDAGVAYAGTVGLNPGASNYAFLQIWNPAGSGKRVVIDQIGASFSVASAGNLYYGQVALTTLVNGHANKKAGSPMGVAELRSQASAIPSTFPLGTVQAMGGGVGIYTTWKPTVPMLLPPGWGLLMMGSAVNVGAQLNLEWFEEAI